MPLESSGDEGRTEVLHVRPEHCGRLSSMNGLCRRIKKLEAASRDHAGQPCRWCGTSWSYPDEFPLVNGVRPPVPPCERPGECPGGGLLVTISTGKDEDEDKIFFMPAWEN